MAPFTNTADQFAEEMAEIMLETLRDYLLDPEVSERYAMDESQAGAFVDQIGLELTDQLRQLYTDMQES